MRGSLWLALLLFALGCTRSPAVPSNRTLAVMQPHINASMKTVDAVRLFGEPDLVTGSGLIIYEYRLSDGGTLVLSFPGFEAIMAARVRDAAGAVRELPLR